MIKRLKEKTKRIRRAFFGVFAASLLAALLLPATARPAQATNPDITSSWDLVREMNPGWSLGNSLEYQDLSYGHVGAENFDVIETKLRNPITTEVLIKAVADAGFKSIRIPASFYNHLEGSEPRKSADDEGYVDDGYVYYQNKKYTNHPGTTIDPDWLKRLQQVVDWALEAGLYVVINDHHDSSMWMNMSWIYAEADDWETQAESLTNIWRQYAEHFKDYDNRLIFQATGEIVNRMRSFNLSDVDDFRSVHHINQAFITAIRETGGNNAERFLMLPTYASNSGTVFVDECLYGGYSDTATGNKLIYSIHNYSTDPEELEWYFSQLYARAKKYDIPFVMDECGAKVTETDEKRRATYEALGKYSAKYEGAVMVWDDGVSEYGLIDRAATIREEELTYVRNWSYTSNGATYSGTSDAAGSVRALLQGVNNAPVLTEEEKAAITDSSLKTVDFQYLTPQTYRITTEYGKYFAQGAWSDSHAGASVKTLVHTPTIRYFACLYPLVAAQAFEAKLPENVSVIIRELDENGNYLRPKYVSENRHRYTPSSDAAYAAVYFRGYEMQDGVKTGVTDESLTKASFDAYVAGGELQLYPVGGTPYESRGWTETDEGLVYILEDGTKANEWEKIDGAWYYFEHTILQTGWKRISGEWYFLKQDGRRAENEWARDSVGWVYLGADGKITTAKNGEFSSAGWRKIEGEWYYLKAGGYRVENQWAKDSSAWYWLGADGKIAKNVWVKDSKGWLYMGPDGKITKSKWIKYKDDWYYLKANGYMAVSEWAKDSTDWYWMGSDGKIAKNVWAKDSKGWCWMGADGKITKNKWIQYKGGWYYLKANGYMATNEYVSDSKGRCWVAADGRWDGKYR